MRMRLSQLFRGRSEATEARLAAQREIDLLERELESLPSSPLPGSAALPDGLRVTVASPCTESWDAMVGNARVRHCSRCDRDVFNLSALSLAEIHALLTEHGQRPCVRFYRRKDGTMLTADCPVNRPERVATRVLLAIAVAIGATAIAEEVLRREVRSQVIDSTMGDVSLPTS